MARRKSRIPNSPQPINLALQNTHVQKRFSNFSCRIKRGCATWRGTLQPRSISPIYQIEILYKQKQIPKVKVVSPPLASDAPHLYSDRSLCLYWPKEWWWQQDKLIADIIIPWAASWLYYYELWLDTGEWLGPSSHDSPKQVNSMPTRRDTNFPSPTDPNEFESMIRDICALEWNDPNTDKFGRKGQKQYGVDVYGQPINLNGEYCATQCKLRTKKEQLTEQEIEAEVRDARQFPHSLDTLIIATDAPRDTHTQILIDQFSQREMSHNGFRVAVWFWDNITERLAAHPKLIVKYYPDFYATLTALPIVERLIDTPLQIVSVTQSPSNSAALLIEDALKLRGIRVIKPDNSLTASAPPLLNDVLPDGVLCSCSIAVKETSESIMLKFAGTVQNHTQQVESICPVFAILPFPLTDLFLQFFEELGGNPQRIQILNTELPLNKLADQILHVIFRYGFARRGGVPTIDIAVRSREGRPRSSLLDLDWQTKLSTSHFPTPTEWEDIFVAAIISVRSQLLSQSDKTRIQINCQLPLPAAFTLGFFFNIRVARVGVWARKAEVSNFKQQFWLSDGDPANVTFVPEWVKQSDGSNQTAVVELTSYVSIHKAVAVFVKETGLVPDVWLQMRVRSREGETIANIEESYAVAYANQVGQVIRHLNEQGITDIHLFARIPSPLAVLIGQRLQACGRIHLYWFDNPTYRFAFSLM